MGEDATKTVTYRYTVTFKDGTNKVFVTDLDYETLGLIQAERPSYAEWTRLSFFQCPNCPLDEARHPRCPVATSLVPIVEAFKDSKSYEEVDVAVEARSRTYTKHGSLQTVLSSLIGIYMTTSGCPILNKLRPMVDTHLPFMTRQETMYRVLAMYLMVRFFLDKDGRGPEHDLKGLHQLLEEIRTVNVAFCKRLNAIQIKDASVNAVVILSTLGDFPGRLVTKQDLERIERILRSLYA